jgi:2-dehydro-3-deoxyphosphooctonate aldolase (KDO 8-P synthase)
MSDSAKPNSAVTVGNVTFGNDRPIALFAGPCQMESRAHALEMASALKEICGRLGIGLVYKTSFDRPTASLSARRGIGLDGAARDSPRSARACLPVVTDVHEASSARVLPMWWTCCDPGLPVPPDRPTGAAAKPGAR